MSERELETLIAQLERQLGMQWSDIVEWLRTQNPADALEKRLMERGLAGSLIERVPDAAARFADHLHDSYVKSGQQAMQWLDDRVPDALIRFDQTNYRAVAKAQAQRYELIQGFDQEQRDVTRRVVMDGLREGVNPKAMAKSLRQSIGLTDAQSRYVEKYRRELETGDFSAALRRELSDGRSDKLLRRLRSEGGALSQEQIDAMAERYRQGWVKYRAETIARTESLRAAHEGHAEAMKQAVERGDIDAEQLENEWHSGPRSKNARDQHLAMNHRRVPFGTDFVMPDGTRMSGPGDPRGGAKHTANCRCTRSTSFARPSVEVEQVSPRAPELQVQQAPMQAKIPTRLRAPNRVLEPIAEPRFREQRAKFEEKLTDQEFKGFATYSGEKYEAINKVLRKSLPHGEHAATIRAMDEGFAKARVPRTMKVLRGSGTGKHFAELKPGDVFVDQAYLSTSIKRSVVEEFADVGGDLGVIWEIEVPKGAYAAPIPSENEGELEFLLPRNSKLRVLAIEKQGTLTHYHAVLEP